MRRSYSIWLVTLIVDFARADQGVRVRAIEALANSFTDSS